MTFNKINMLPKLALGTPFSATDTDATAAVASQAGVAGVTHYVTDICASSDKAEAILLVKDGTTVIWQVQISTTPFSHSFVIPLKGSVGVAVSVEIDGTAACKANIAGVTI